MSVPTSSAIFKAIRVEVFGFDQERFGAKLGYTVGTICKLERANRGTRVRVRHLRLLRLLKAPPGKAEHLQALLDRLTQVVEEQEPEGYLKAEERRRAEEAAKAESVQRALETARRVEQIPGEVVRVEEAIQRAERLLREEALGKVEASVRRAEEARQRAEQLSLEADAARAEAHQRLEDGIRRTEAAVERVEALGRELEAGRDALARRLDEAVRRAEEAAQRAERLCREQEARLAEEARSAAETARREEQRRLSEHRQFRRRAFAAVAAVVVVQAVGLIAAWRMGEGRQRASAGETAQATNGEPHDRDTAPVTREPMSEEPGEEGAVNSGLDAGTELTKIVKQALPMSKGPAVPDQLAAPCPEETLTEEFNGYCWMRFSLTPAQVRAGHCDQEQLYEPSEGWCRSHGVGYRPYRQPIRQRNSVEPQ